MNKDKKYTSNKKKFKLLGVIAFLFVVASLWLGLNSPFMVKQNPMDKLGKKTIHDDQIAGGTATGNAIENLAQNSELQKQEFITSIPVLHNDSNMLLELNQVYGYGFSPEKSALHPNDAMDDLNKNQAMTQDGGASEEANNLQEEEELKSFNSSFIDQDRDQYGTGSELGNDCDDLSKNIKNNCSYKDLEDWLKVNGADISGRRFYISTDGNNSTAMINNHQKAYADFAIIKDSIKAGDVVIYRKGNYTKPEQMPSLANGGSIDLPIYIVGWPGENINLISNNGLTLDKVNNVYFINLNWKKSENTALNIINSENILIKRCLFEENQSNGVLLKESKDIQINFNVFRNNGQGIYSLNSATKINNNLIYLNNYGIDIIGSHDATIKSNIIHSNAIGVKLSNSSAKLLIENNLLMLNSKVQLEIKHQSTPSFLIIKSNTLWSDAKTDFSFFINSDSTLKIDFNDNIVYSDSNIAIKSSNQEIFKYGIFSRNIIHSSRSEKSIEIGLNNTDLNLIEWQKDCDECRNNLNINPGFRPKL